MYSDFVGRGGGGVMLINVFCTIQNRVMNGGNTGWIVLF